MEGTLLLLSLMVTAYAVGNLAVAMAAACLIVLALLDQRPLLAGLAPWCLQLGIFLMLVSLLAPFVLGQVSALDLRRALSSPGGWVAIAIAALGARLAQNGIHLLQGSPETTVAIALGSIVGVAFLGGAPAGPLMAAGMVGLLLRLLR